MDVQYAQTDDAQIAYRVTGEPGGVDVVMVAGALFPFEMLAEDRTSARFCSGLAALGRLVVFDKRGVGLSDPITDWSRPIQEQWADDLIAVVEDAGLLSPVVVSWDQMGVARFAAAARPQLFSAMVLINPTSSAEEPRAVFHELTEGSLLPNRRVEEVSFPSRIGDEAFTAWLLKSGRAGASPTSASRIWEHVLGYKGVFTPPGITVRTLVLHNRDCRQSEASVRTVVGELANATFVQVAGRDIYPIAGDVDQLTAEIAEFVTGKASALAPQRSIAAVLFTDLVASTERVASKGDAQWRELLDAHDRCVQHSVHLFGGRVVKYTGDGVLALLPSATRALDAARSIVVELGARGLDVRVGIHVGDVDVRGDDVSGLAVNIAARVMARARVGETVVSDSVRLATLGCGHNFVDLGPTELRGVPGTWTLYRWEVPD